MATILGALRSIYAISIGAAIGVIVFFSAVVAESAFATFDETTAGTFLAHVFPSYYTLTGVLFGVGFVASFAGFPSLRRASARVSRWSVFVAGLLMLVSGVWLLPAMNHIRLAAGNLAAGTALDQRFFMYHGVSMVFDLLAGLLGIVGLGVFAWEKGARRS
jgi:hypothetical protein